MDELGFNKIAGAVLATGLGLMGLINAPKIFIKNHYPATPAYSVGAIEAPEAAGDDKPLPFPQADWVAAMDAAKGATAFKACQACHSINNGGPNKVGPNLYNIVGAAAGARDGFSYSSAVSGSGVTWGFEELDAFLTKPSKYLKGTKMSYNGIKKPEKRAAVIEYLRQAADAPIAQPSAATSDAMMTPEMKDGIDKAEAMVDGAKDKMDAMVDGKADNMVEGAKDKAETMIEGGKDKAGAMIDGSKDKTDVMIEGAKNKAGDKMDALKDKMEDKIKEKADDGH